jgi:hypothetical protein
MFDMIKSRVHEVSLRTAQVGDEPKMFRIYGNEEILAHYWGGELGTEHRVVLAAHHWREAKEGEE